MPLALSTQAFSMRFALLAAGLVAASASQAQTAAPDPYHELETKYLFGFTQGADIGAEGEQSVEFETTTQFGRRYGHYGTLEQEVEYESVPSQYLGYELSAHTLGYSISGVDGLANARGVEFSGLSTQFNILAIGRGPGSPFGVTFVIEPEWARLDDGGQPTKDFSSAFVGIVDTELVANRLYGAVNLSYTPDISQSPGQAWQRTSTLGATAGLAYRVAPKVTLGGEAEYYRAYDSLALQSLQGQAVYLGPTLHIQFTGKIMLSAALSTEVSGRATGETHGLDLTNFPHQRGNMKIEFEF